MFYKFFLLLLILSLSIYGLVSSKSQESTTTDSDDHPPCCKNDPKTVCNCTSASPKLTSIPDGIGKDTKSFDASYNDISTIITIPETDALEKLDLSHNKIVNISYDAFDNLDYLKVLILSYNELKNIGDDIFEWNPLELKVIHLDHNKLEFIQHFLFYDLDQLFEIDLSFNNITFIHPHAFGQLKTLVTLKLNNNFLHTLDHRWFSPMSSDYLAAMDLRNNPWSCDCAMQKRLESIKKMQHVTPFMEQLTCQKGDHKGEYLIKIDSSEKLRCEAPVITGISEDATMRSGQTLKLQCVLDQNRVPSATVVWKAPNQDTYNYHNADKYDGIEAHPDGALFISSFRKSDAGTYECHATNDGGEVMAETVIKFVEGEADANEEKPKLEIPAKTTTEEKGDFNSECPHQCRCLSRMADCGSAGDPTKDKLREFPSGIPQDIYSINMVSNELHRVAAGILNFPSLIEIRFDDNFIDTVEEYAFDQAKKLQTLSLKNNKLTSLPANIFVKLEMLDKLILDDNQLEHLDPAVFNGLEKLVWLYIRDNKLLEIKESTFKPLQSLEYIHLENNHLHSFPLEVVKELTERDATDVRGATEIKRIFVMGNEFYCDCRFTDLHKYLTAHNDGSETDKTDLFGDGIQCGFPDSYIDKYLMELREDQLVCPSLSVNTENKSSSRMTGLWFGGMILGIALCVAFIFFIRRRGGRSCFKRQSTNYASLTAQDADYTSLVGGSTVGGGSEAFV